MIRIAVIGIGKLGQRHLEKWSQIKGVEIVGVIARNEERLREISEQYETIACKSIEELIGKVDVDVIDICTPTHTHGRFIKEAAIAKKHIICEKPLALSSGEAEALATMCTRNNVRLFVGHTLQFFPVYEVAKEQINKGLIGHKPTIHMSRGVPYPANEREWYVDETKSGGLLLDLGVHEFEWILSTFGHVKSVFTDQVRYADESKQAIIYGVVTLKFNSGAVANIELSWDEPAFRASFTISGDQGVMTYNHTESAPVFTPSDHHLSKQISLGHQSKKDPYVKQLEHFINCILGKEEPFLDTEDAVKAIDIAEAARQSAEKGKVIVMKQAK